MAADPELYIFDVDGTLIEGFLGTETCSACDGEGRIKVPRPATADHILTDTEPWGWANCEPCKGKGQKFSDHRPYDEVRVLPGRVERIADIARAKPHARFALATNQGGVALEYQTRDQVEAKMATVISEVFPLDRRATLYAAYCHKDAKSSAWLPPNGYDWRKPEGGMIRAAMRKTFDGDDRFKRHLTTMVGDLATDRDAAEDAGVRFMWAEEFFA